MDQRRLAGAVRANDRVQLALGEVQADVVDRQHAAEALLQAGDAQGRRGHGLARHRRARPERPPIRPSGANSTTASSTTPMPSGQWIVCSAIASSALSNTA